MYDVKYAHGRTAAVVSKGKTGHAREVVDGRRVVGDDGRRGTVVVSTLPTSEMISRQGQGKGSTSQQTARSSVAVGACGGTRPRASVLARSGRVRSGRCPNHRCSHDFALVIVSEREIQ